MPTGPEIILTLKVLVTAVTVLFACAVAAILAGHKRLHGRLNVAFFVLTMTTVVGFEVLIRLGTDVTASFSDEARQMLRIHLGFALPAARLPELRVAMEAAPNRRSYIRLAVIRSLLMGLERRVMVEQFCRPDR